MISLKKFVQLAIGLVAALSLGVTPAAAGSGSCTGKFPNPFSDVCWSCMFPLSLGSIAMFKGDKPDTDNPGSPVCACPAPPPLFLRIGLSVGFWEPVRMADVTTKPYCFVNLGGLKIDPGIGYPQKSENSMDHGVGKASGYHVHWYIYPVMVWMEILTDFLCLERTSFDVAYLTELDPLWNDDSLTTLLNPEALIFANPIATAACSIDCAASSVGGSRKELFWCAGCQGTMYPMNGNIAGEYGDIQGGLQAAERFAFKMHRMLLADGTSGPSAVCEKYKMPIMDKRQYRFQLINPVPHTGGKFTCPNIGRTTVTYEGGKSIPIKGEDYGYLVWRKRNCCATIIP